MATRIRTRLHTEAVAREQLAELLYHALAKAGNASLMTAELIDTLVDHAAGNYRLLMTLGGESLAYGISREVAELLAYIRSLQRQLDLSVILVHHTRKNAPILPDHRSGGKHFFASRAQHPG